MAAQQVNNQHNGDDRNRREEPALPTLLASQEAEGGPAVIQQGEIKKRQNRHAFGVVKPAVKPDLADLVENDNGQRTPQPYPKGGRRHGSAGRRVGVRHAGGAPRRQTGWPHKDGTGGGGWERGGQ